LLIGSAGDIKFGKGKSNPSKSDKTGCLDTFEDIQDAKTFMRADPWIGNSRIHATMNYEGASGSYKEVLRALDKFFEKCKENDWQPTIYYTGHGNRDGNWCFHDGIITFDNINDLVVKHQGPSWWTKIYCDCCYSGQWAKLAAGKHALTVLAACGPDQLASNRQFAKAKFDGDKAARKALLNDGAVMVEHASQVKALTF